MGKSSRAKNNDKMNFAQKRRARENKWNEDAPRRQPYSDIVRENPDFSKYYKMQNIVPEGEWDAFLAALQENLPTAFRITGSKAEASMLLAIVRGQLFSELLNPAAGGPLAAVQLPVCIPWYPDNLAWQLTLSRKDIRRSESYSRLHNFLITETNCGGISRQEVVSMIPPIVLDVRPHHKVLDMCAAPGSKTVQLIEMLHAEEAVPAGVVVANDVDNSRCYMLVHQAKRLNSPCLLVTNHDSSVMPNITVTGEGGEKTMLKFDRVLADVPCSGDGTLRKNPDIWMKWNSANGNNLHGIQYRIAKRGAELLTVGGRLVYSTCSLNPIEDEAVMHRLLVETQGALQLADVTARLPGLKFRRGVSHWSPTSRDLVGYEKYEDVPEKWTTLVRPSMFPPAPQDAHKFCLDRCIRILPHHQDSGGFFIAVLEKLRPLPWESAGRPEPAGAPEDSAANPPGDSAPREPQRKRRRVQTYKEDPFLFLDKDEPIWPSIREFYDLSSELQPSQFLTRCREGKKKNIYLTSPSVRDIIVNNEDKIKIINTGVKTFARSDNKGTTCNFRLANEGIHSIFPYVGSKRKVRVGRKDMITLLDMNSPAFPPHFDLLSEEARQQFQNIEQGSCVLVCEDRPPEDQPDYPPLSLVTAGWRGATSARAYVSSPDCVRYLRLCGADVSDYEVKKAFKDKSASEGGSRDAEAMRMEVDGLVCAPGAGDGVPP
ncbi:tRNA (cytosine(34)-C(5))-methyltransferase [Bacillus rossius redtenbacheri]|uniref:tRNA (cytosine(34)-C(5))-methyltransferase n=1 Tax=Bacillus rossius redtenbacheri TaxID=93214 RepID=UPI002FDD0A53